ncbi:hypothetical protein [Flavobacterium daejeonense]|uniref:hypothetical protein n=1 Tax=Flavobacterium daejeonense TaxID=350893 RepID=UPI00047C9D91|nr:hypothetical protein [Flavobacterium daejeonense]
MDKRLQLKVIIKKCEQKFGRGDAENWKHNDFNDFSAVILEETKINISPNTLKRIFGKIPTDKYYLPQQATFDALISYSEIDENELADETSNAATIPVTNKTKIKPKNSKIKLGIFALLLIALFAFAYIYFDKSGIDTNEIQLKLSSSEGLLPKTCYFDIKLPNTNENLYIDFGDRSPLINLQPKQKIISHTYYIPGVFDVSITNKVKKLSKSKVFVSTDNEWYMLGFQRQRIIPDNYYAVQVQKNQDSLFYISNNQLLKQGIDTIQPFFIRVCNYAPIKQNADNFIFEATFKKGVQYNAISCNGLVFKISGSQNYIRFNFVNPGCSSRITNIISEKTIKGTNHNLSPFVVDFQKWNTIKLINKDKKLRLFVNDSPIYETVYNNSLGDLRGLFVEFERNGLFKNCHLSSLNGEILYQF